MSLRMNWIEPGAGLLAVLLLLAAGGSSTGPASGGFPHVVEITGCNERDGSDPDAARACIEYDYDGEGVLTLLHTNTTFNCCPLDYGGRVTVTEGEILIEELEGQGQCDCLCAYDILYRIEDLEPGLYGLVIEELYPGPGNEAFDLVLDLGVAVSGEICLEREGYPWE